MNGNPTYKVCVWCNTYNQASYIKDTMDGFCMQQTSFPFTFLAVCKVTKINEYSEILNILKRRKNK